MAELDIQKRVQAICVGKKMQQGLSLTNANIACREEIANKNKPNSVMVVAKPTTQAATVKPAPVTTPPEAKKPPVEKPAVNAEVKTTEAPVQLRSNPQDMMKERIIQSLMAKGLSKAKAESMYTAKQNNFVNKPVPVATTVKPDTVKTADTRIDTTKTAKPITPLVVPTAKTVQTATTVTPKVEIPKPTTKTDNTRTAPTPAQTPAVAPTPKKVVTPGHLTYKPIVSTTEINAQPDSIAKSLQSDNRNHYMIGSTRKVAPQSENSIPRNMEGVQTEQLVNKAGAMSSEARNSKLIAPAQAQMESVQKEELQSGCATFKGQVVNCHQDNDGKSTTGNGVTTTTVSGGAGFTVTSEHSDAINVPAGFTVKAEGPSQKEIAKHLQELRDAEKAKAKK